MAIKNPFRTGAGAVNRAAADATAARQGRAQNLTMAADQWRTDPAREAGYGDFMDALRTQLGQQTDRGFADSSRRQRFATARQGLTGGSVDVDRQRGGLEDLFARRIGNEATVQDAGQMLRNQDTANYQSLIDAAYGSADVGQNAMRSLLGSQAQNASYMRGLLPQTAQDLGSVWARHYGVGQESDEYNRSRGYWGGY